MMPADRCEFVEDAIEVERLGVVFTAGRTLPATRYSMVPISAVCHPAAPKIESAM